MTKPQHLISVASIFLPHLLITILPTTAHSAEPQWQVGLATVCITPDEPVWLYGYAGKKRFQPYESVLDDIYASAMAIQSGDTEPAVLIAADLCVLREPEATALGKVLTQKTGLPRGQILLNWSHTHSGPMLAPPTRTATRSKMTIARRPKHTRTHSGTSWPTWPTRPSRT